MTINIRKFSNNDLDNLYHLLSNPNVMKYLEPPYTMEATEAFLVKAGLSEMPLIYAVEKDGAFIGYIIFHGYDAESIEIGWVLEPSCWNAGIASFLTEKMIAKAAELGKRVVIECAPNQTASIRIAEKFGFKKLGIADGLLVFRL